MRVIHIEFLTDFVGWIISGVKTETRRPLRIQPIQVEEQLLIFGGSDMVYRSDYPCPYGEPGDVLLFVPEASPYHFHEAKVVRSGIESLNDCDYLREGYPTIEEFLKKWDEIYGETSYASCFNPFCWSVRWQS